MTIKEKTVVHLIELHSSRSQPIGVHTFKQPCSWHRYQMTPNRTGGSQSTSYIGPEEKKMNTSSAQLLEFVSKSKFHAKQSR